MRTRSLLLALLAAGCGDDVVAVTASAGSTGSTGSTSTSTTGDITPTEAGTSTSTTGTGSASATSEAVTTSTAGSTSTGTTEAPDTTTDDPGSTTDTSTGSTSAGSSTSTGSTGDGTTADASTSSTGTTADTTGGSSSTGDDTGEPPVEALGYVGMSTDDSLMIFDPQTKQVVAGPISLLPEANYPYDAIIKPDGAELWVVGASGDGVKVLDTGTGTLTQQIDLTGVGEYPVDLVFSLDGARAYVSSRDSESLVLIDTATYSVDKAVPMPIGVDAGKAAIDPCTGIVHFVRWYDGDLLRFDPMTEAVTSKPLGDSLWDLRIDPSGATMYVTDRGLDVVHVLDVASLQVQATVPVGDDPWGIDITSDGALVVVACEDDATVHFIDTATLTPEVLALPADAKPRDVSISIDDARAYVPTGSVGGNDGVYELDLATRTLAATIDLGVNTNSNVVAVKPQPVTCTP
jgi:YVTN family beta-propeller protein